ncbi:putative cell division control protein Cdc25 [Talaromyces proteolyticus]|uniref:Class E vacuolar protein-sorting machinery protein HSE1 n=1 Tax=Talaromyces proteolyticus TaxID=1131652 RepID=A0AAD4PZS9_9EURO|nr:putative cell division control protein Cdc25 [Talaromyces proteolyticus]KAH8696682.1 putative cell division control protein Cdc25 [Talaromyces proteolyticus]
MYQAGVEPVALNLHSGFASKTGAFATTLRYTDDEQSDMKSLDTARARSAVTTTTEITHENHRAPPALYVKALYDYDADDHTSLSFRQGDIIQVLNQLETGWWDGVIGNVRGWFPSNYCAVVTNLDEIEELSSRRMMTDAGDTSAESGVDEDYEDEHEDELDFDHNQRDSHPILPIEGAGPVEQEEAAFWIPQATPDGRLFYFNTLTGTSTMELPLENPLLANEAGPRDRNNFFVPEQTRPPPEMMARGVERDEDDYDGSGSEGEGESLMLASRDSMSRRRRSLTDDVSPATSMDSLNPSPVTKVAQQAKYTGQTSFPQSIARPSNPSSSIPRHFVDDTPESAITWSDLLENMRNAIEAYRQTIRSGDSGEYVRKAEAISDHLRLLLAAGSDTTDNHSGNPSIISSNRTLYPHFRDMMSKFSKLVLSSHIAASDWTNPDSATKCLQEVDGVWQGVCGYVEVAHRQRGETINRIVPGFVLNSFTGGHWLNNGIKNSESGATSFLEPESQDFTQEALVSLDAALLDQIDVMRKSLALSIRKLEEQLVLGQKAITQKQHRSLSDTICLAALSVIEKYRPWIMTVESINLASLGTSLQNPQLVDFGMQKQRVYETIADLVLSCQSVSAPLGDEWAELRGDSLEDRLNTVRSVARQLEAYTSQIGFSLSLLQEQIPEQSRTTNGQTHFIDDGGILDPFQKNTNRAESGKRRGTESSVQALPTFTIGIEDEDTQVRRNMNKAHRFFGQAPPTTITREPLREPVAVPEETPWFLNFDHEGEVFYDNKSDVPALKCGTLEGLVEQLTRHDKLDASFNNTFLLTYRSFTTAAELFDKLVQRFGIQPPYGLNPDELRMWVDRKQKPIRFRVVNILKSWFENFWMEPSDEANMNLLRQVHDFTKDSIATTKTPGSPQLLSVIEQRLRGQDTTVKRLKLKFLDIDPTEFARQLTVIESRLYGKIRATECLNKTWQRKVATGESEPAANVKALILHSNQLTNWVAEMILTQGDVKKRVVVIKHFVNVADKCRTLNNYSTLTSIISALGTAPIHRLGRTWAQVSGRTSAVLEQMRRLMASTKNFGEYRETLHAANPPCIPFFGVYLTDLTFIEDGIPSHTPSDLINFNKRAKTAEVIRDIQQYQNVPYQLQSVPELQDYILSNMQAAGDVHEMYDRSLEVEPREREDEKIARYGKNTDVPGNLTIASIVAAIR